MEELSKVSSGKFVRASLLEGTLKVSSGKLVGKKVGKPARRSKDDDPSKKGDPSRRVDPSRVDDPLNSSPG